MAIFNGKLLVITRGYPPVSSKVAEEFHPVFIAEAVPHNSSWPTILRGAHWSTGC